MAQLGRPYEAGAVASQNGLLRFKTADQLKAEDEIARRTAAELAAQQSPKLSPLAAFVRSTFETNAAYRDEAGIDDDMLAALRQRASEYDDQTKEAISQQGGTDVFAGVTDVKCRAGEAWLRDVLTNDDGKPWSLRPTPIPDIPEETRQSIVLETIAKVQSDIMATGRPVDLNKVTQYAAMMRDDIMNEIIEEATSRAARMEHKIHDQMVEGGWDEAFDDFISDLVTLKAGFIKGPVPRRRKRVVNKKVRGRTRPVVEYEIVPTFTAPSPFDMFPSRGATTCQDGNLVERCRFDRKSLLAMKGVPGWRDDAINAVISEYDEGGLRVWTSLDSERSELEKRGSDIEANREKLEGLELWGSALGKTLIEDGMDTGPDGKSIDPIEEYEINAVLIGSWIVYAGFNDDPLGDRPYSHTGWAKIVGSFWFRSVPELMRDLQRICNSTIRSLVNNEAIASGPQVIYNDISRIPDGENISGLWAWKIHQFLNTGLGGLKPIEFYQPSSNAGELMNIYIQFSNMCDDYTGIPAYAHGNDNVTGAGRTLGGLSMLMTNAARGIKMVIGRIDQKIYRPVVTRLYNYNMLYDPDESIKGDAQIEAVGALAQIVKEEAALRRMEYLNTTNNPTDSQIVGLLGRAKVHREVVKSLDMRPDDIVRKDDVLAQVEARLNELAAAEGAAA